VSEVDSITRFIETCDNCEMPVCGAYTSDADDEEDIEVWPKAVSRKSYRDVPEAIASAASEAHQALGAFAPRAAVAMARAVVEATAKQKGITGGRLESKIDNLAEEGLISEATKEVAHEIRFAGNEVAHGDLVQEPVSVEGARDIVELMDVILQRVYQEPAKVARIRADREARRSRQQPVATTS
jgi:hypothetical protein